MFDPTIPNIIAGRYRVIRELGRGGMGVVLLVEHVNTGDQLALKLLHAHAGANQINVDRFKREARASALIKSENVVRITDADVAPELGGAPFLVMELLDGCDIERWLTDNGAMSAPEVVRILTQVASAIDRAHANKIVHRDLKPENIYLHRTGNDRSIVKILDFGISKMLQSPETPVDGNVSTTRTGAVMGTPLYMAPEQAKGEVATIGPGVDVWAFGLIAFRMLTNQDYWKAESFALLIMEIVVSPLVPPSQRSSLCDARFDEWFLRCCDRDVASRFRSTGEAAVALARALGLEPTRRPEEPFLVPITHRPPAVPTTTTAPAVHTQTANEMARTTLGEARPRRRAWPWLVAVAGVSVAVVGSVVAMRPKSDIVAPNAPAGLSEIVAPLRDPLPEPVSLPSASSAPAPPSASVAPPLKPEPVPRAPVHAGTSVKKSEKPAEAKPEAAKPEPAKPFNPMSP